MPYPSTHETPYHHPSPYTFHPLFCLIRVHPRSLRPLLFFFLLYFPPSLPSPAPLTTTMKHYSSHGHQQKGAIPPIVTNDGEKFLPIGAKDGAQMLPTESEDRALFTPAGCQNSVYSYWLLSGPTKV